MELQTKQLVLAIKQIAEEKNLPEDTVHDVIEQALAAAYRKDYGDKDQEVRSVVNSQTGDFKVFVSKTVVADDEVDNDMLEIGLTAAKKINKDVKKEETVEIEDAPETFGRVAAQTAKQVIMQRLREAEREIVLEEYQDRIGTVVNGTVARVDARVVRVDLGKAQGIIPKSEQIPGEYYSAGARIKVFLRDVERTNRGPQLILSRANEEFIQDLFRNEVPEMENGAVKIEAIAREAGVRTKIAVSASVPGVDPVGTFVGGHGTRVQAVMSEVGDQEKIDIITYDEDIKKLIENALSPTKVDSVEIEEKDKKAVVKVAEDQLSVAIGKSGQNVRLASMLTGYDIDIESAGATSEEKNPKSDDKAKPKPASKAKKVSADDREPKPEKKFKSKEKLEESLLDAIEESD